MRREAITALLALCLIWLPVMTVAADTEGDLRRTYGITQSTNPAGLVVPNFANGYKLNGTNVPNSGSVSRRITSITAASTAKGNATGDDSEGVFSNGTATIAANTLVAGDTIRFRAHVAVPNTNSTNTLRIYVRIGGLSGTAIYDSTAIDVADNNYVSVDGEITFRTVGATGTAYAVVNQASLLAASAVATPTATAASSLDTTAALTLVVTGVWSVKNAGNSAALQLFNVYHN